MPQEASGSSVSIALPPEGLIFLVGDAGAGKTVALARLGYSASHEERPVLYCHAGELYPPTPSPAAVAPLEDALVGELTRRGVDALMARQWIADGELVVFIDGMNETPYGDDALLDAAITFVEHHELCLLVATTRSLPDIIRQTTETVWTMPPLAPSTAREEVLGLDYYRLATEAQKGLIEEVCRNPLMLAMARELDGAPPEHAVTLEAARGAIVSASIRTRLNWRNESPPREAAFSCWLAHAMSTKSLGSTLELRSISWTLLPKRARDQARALSLFLVGLPIFLASSVFGWVLGLGNLGVVASFVCIMVIFIVGNLPMAQRLVARRRWEVVAKRSYSFERVCLLGVTALRRLAWRALQGAALGAATGVYQWAIFYYTPTWMDNSEWFIWMSIAIVPALVALFGALLGGLLAGPLGGAAFGMEASGVEALIGGLVAAMSATIYFTLVDLGDVKIAPPVDGDQRSVLRTLVRSARQQTQFSVVTWLIFGVAGGSLNWLAHGGDIDWLLQGVATGAVGAVLFGLVALVSPITSYTISDFGLRRSGLLPSGSLDQMLLGLMKMRILVAAGSKAVFRFSHPLVGEYLDSEYQVETGPEVASENDSR